MFRSVQSKIIVLVSFIAIILLLAIFINWLNETAEWKLLFTERQQSNKILLENVIREKGENLKSFAYDYSYWDEMVNFISTGNKEWAKINIDEPLAHFNIQAAWVFKLDFTSLYSYNEIGIPDFEYPINKDALRNLISQNYFSHFFIYTRKGLLEIRTAPIQHSNDTQRSNPPFGYFVVGRLWTDKFINELELFTSSKLSLSDNDTSRLDELNKFKQEFSVVTSIDLPGWNKRPVGKIISVDESNYIKEALLDSKSQVISSSIFALILISAISYFLLRFINEPINTISKSLLLNTPSLIESLLKEENEFGRLANLIKNFFEQKKRLLEEINYRKNAEEMILHSLRKERELNELKSRFVSMVSHEYKTPLASILSSAEIMKIFVNELSDAEKQKHIATIIKNVDNLNEMLNDVLYINQAEAGKIQFQPENFELVSYCKELVDDIQPTAAGKKKIMFTSNCESRKVYADKKLLNHILLNLLSNSIKYSQDNSAIKFRLQFEERYIMFAVSNYGVGIMQEDKDKIFNAFFRAKNIESIGGTGLGLAIAKICSDLHNGEISFESSPGDETTFIFKLPL